MLETIYNSYAYIKATFTREQAKINQYDPYQVDQLKTHFNFNPYHKEEDVANITDEFLEVETTINDSPQNDEKDCNESIVVIGKRKRNQVQVQDEAEHRRPIKRIRIFARNMTGNSFHTFIYGAVVAYAFIWAEKAKVLPIQPPVEPEKKKKMRGFGVDFAPLVERPAALQFRIERAEKDIRDICQEARKTVQEDIHRLKAQKSYGGLPVNKTFDDHEWSFIEKDCNVHYKVILYFVYLTRDIVTHTIS
jgi:hypothetical protein